MVDARSSRVLCTKYTQTSNNEEIRRRNPANTVLSRYRGYHHQLDLSRPTEFRAHCSSVVESAVCFESRTLCGILGTPPPPGKILFLTNLKLLRVTLRRGEVEGQVADCGRVTLWGSPWPPSGREGLGQGLHVIVKSFHMPAVLYSKFLIGEGGGP